MRQDELEQGGGIDAPGDEAAALHAQAGGSRFRCPAAVEGTENAGAGAGEMGGAEGTQSVHRLGDFGVAADGHRFEGVAARTLQEIILADARHVALQQRVGEQLGGADVDRWTDDQEPAFGQRHRGDQFAHALGPGAAATNENRHVRAELAAEFGQLVLVQAGLPEKVEGNQAGGGVRAAAADPTAERQALVQVDVRAQRRAGDLLQQARGAYRQPVVLGHAAGGVGFADHAIGADREGEAIAVIQQLEDGLQFVIAIRASSRDAQHQVEFGRGGPPLQQSIQGHRRHRSMITRRFRSMCIRSSRPGRVMPLTVV